MLTRIAREKALPFDPLVPNAKTIAAMKEARRGKLEAVTLTDCKRCWMRKIRQTGQFKRDLKREPRGPYRNVIQNDFVAIVETLASDKVLDPKYCDHSTIR